MLRYVLFLSCILFVLATPFAGHCHHRPSPAAHDRETFGIVERCAELTPDRRSVADLVGAADQALYQAKTTGRNRIVTAPVTS